MKENLESYFCECCGFETETYEGMNTDAIEMNYCEDCFFEQYAYCEDCGCIIDKNEAYYIEESDVFFCDYCSCNNNVFYCDHHNRYEIGADESYLTIGDERICFQAIELGYYFQCPACLNVYDIDWSCWSEEYGENYCCDCYEELQSDNKIKSYHDHEDDYENNMLKTNKDKNTCLYFGMELEIENRIDMNSKEDLAEAILDITENFVFENDGSLNDGFEIISYPFTKNYMKEILAKDIIKMLQTIKNYGFDSLDTCGLHFHVSENAIENKTELVMLVEYFKEELTIFSRRKESELSRWSKFYTEGMEKEEITKEIIQNKIDDCWSRYRAVNLDNFHTVEFRIFKGTTDYKQLLATWELINNIVSYINDNEIDINNIPAFKDVATYKEDNYISEYIDSLGLEL